MKFEQSHTLVFQSVLSGNYTPYDVREFIKFCHDLALPYIRKRIALGKINLELLGMKEQDVVYDCIADLFQRDANGTFIQVTNFFLQELPDNTVCSIEEFVIVLRRLVANKVNHNIVRIHSETDPALGKILRNLKSALERTSIFAQITRFGEPYLVPAEHSTLMEKPPIPYEFIQREFSTLALVYDTVPELLTKLLTLLLTQQEYQRAVPLLSAALLFKHIYTLNWSEETHVRITTDFLEEQHDVETLVNLVCLNLSDEMYPRYVGKGKCSAVEFELYVASVRDILSNHHETGGITYFDVLKQKIPNLTKVEYEEYHKSILEYFVKTAKQKLRKELK
ncbi:MAG: hypothetical protein HYZ34_04075 [Ignavibacteriae bacterium]|nr:hypothetical protein [Ignavibacteriota bacterium]